MLGVIEQDYWYASLDSLFSAPALLTNGDVSKLYFNIDFVINQDSFISIVTGYVLHTGVLFPTGVRMSTSSGLS
jgi:hypothetical protein